MCASVVYLHAAAPLLKIAVRIDHHSRVQVHSSDDDRDELNIVVATHVSLMRRATTPWSGARPAARLSSGPGRGCNRERVEHRIHIEHPVLLIATAVFVATAVIVAVVAATAC